jgi:hypothetical protein
MQFQTIEPIFRHLRHLYEVSTMFFAETNKSCQAQVGNWKATSIIFFNGRQPQNCS